MSEVSRTRFARNGNVHIAYQTVGQGDLDLLLMDTWVHHVEAVWDLPDLARFLRRLSSFGRLIHFDRRGTGLSDPMPLDRLPDLTTQVGDALAVLADAGSERAAMIGLNDGTIGALLLASGHPDRCQALVLFAPTAHQTLPDGSFESIEQVVQLIESGAGTDDSGVEWLAPSRLGDERFSTQLARLQRLSVRPGAIGHYYRQTMEADVTDVLATITTPTLVMNRTHNRVVPVEQSRAVAEAIAGARFVELSGSDHLPFSEGLDAVLEEIEEFLTGSRAGADPDRMLTTLLFTDIVDSTRLAAEVGDRRWRDLLDEHHRLGRAALDRFGGREVATTGDGFFARFERPVGAVRCALSMADGVPSLGLQIRAGVHTGEVEVRGADLGGLAVHIAARIMGLAGPGEILVSSTVKDLLVGSTVRFEDRAEHELKGVPGTWRLFAATGASPG